MYTYLSKAAKVVLFLAMLSACVPLQKFEDDDLKAKLVFQRKKQQYIDSIQKLFENKIKVLQKNNTTLTFKIKKRDQEILDLREEAVGMRLKLKETTINQGLEKNKDSAMVIELQNQIAELKKKNAEKKNTAGAVPMGGGVGGATVSANTQAGNANVPVLQTTIKAKDKEIASLRKRLSTGSIYEKDQIYYRIQVTTIKDEGYSQSIIDGFNQTLIRGKGLLKFVIGNFNSYEDAVQGRKVLLKLGFNRSWIVKYKNGKRIK